MAYIMGAEKKNNFTGKILALIGTPICRMIGKFQKLSGKSIKFNTPMKGFILLCIFALIRFIVWSFERKK